MVLHYSFVCIHITDMTDYHVLKLRLGFMFYFLFLSWCFFFSVEKRNTEEKKVPFFFFLFSKIRSHERR